MKLFQASDIVLEAPPDEKKDFGLLKISELNFKVADDTNLAEMLEESQMGDVICYHSDGKFSQHQLVASICEKVGPSSLHFATWTLTEDPVRVLYKLYEKGLITSVIALFDERIKTYSSNGLQFASTFFEKIGLSKSHAKITVLENESWSIVVLGSANWSNNPRLEAGTILFSKAAAQHYKLVINSKIEKYDNRANKGS